MANSEPTILLRFAETLYVTLAVIIQELERRTDYPTDNIWLALGAYEAGRDDYLRSKGWSEADRMEITAAATEALTQWLDERQMAGAALDFEIWQAEMSEEDDDYS